MKFPITKFKALYLLIKNQLFHQKTNNWSFFFQNKFNWMSLLMFQTLYLQIFIKKNSLLFYLYLKICYVIHLSKRKTSKCFWLKIVIIYLACLINLNLKLHFNLWLLPILRAIRVLIKCNYKFIIALYYILPLNIIKRHNLNYFLRKKNSLLKFKNIFIIV